MKRLFAILTLLAILLTSCTTLNAETTDQTTNTQQAEQNADTTTTDNGATKQVRPDRTKREDEPEGIARFELNETFQNLLDEVNTEHEAVKMYDGDYEQYLVLNKEEGFDLEDYALAPSSIPPGTTVLTLDQVKEDLEYLYKALRTHYGCYEYFGGDEVFRPAIDAVIADCAALETITFSKLHSSLLDRMSFIEDLHFSIDFLWLDGYEQIIPFFFRNVAYQKTENGYETLDGKVVSSVDGFVDLDELFKRSLTKDGDLVYYPILLDPTTKVAGRITCSIPALTVRYTDGSTDQLTPSDHYFERSGTSTVDVRTENGIPVITVGGFYPGSDGLKFDRSAFDYRERDIVMVDLRYNSGGDCSKVERWMQNYASRPVWPNSMTLLDGNTLHTLTKYAMSHAEEEFAPMDNVTIMLAGKATCSAGENMVDMGYNMENTLIVGENTFGVLVGSAGRNVTLPNSGVYLEIGTGLHLHPEGHFEEYRGFFPDIWCPADEAKEAVMNFIKKNTTVTYEQAEK